MAAENVTRIMEAIFRAIETEGRGVTLNDVLSGLASAEARFISAIPERKHRKAVIEAMDGVRRDMIARFDERGGGPRVVTLQAGNKP